MLGYFVQNQGSRAVDLVDGMIRNAPEDVDQEGLGLRAVHLCRGSDGVEASGPLTPGIKNIEQVVLSSENRDAHGALNRA